ncbi:hypothetical protein RM572_00620 [Streptomyces sp. DSM 42041]|uniref:Uncharacterized protein n=1 Tax=Streptomyces hazeniae TaxID=3075538 RepID=A0ABU2NJV6_9ACTN|nr:hypothetical protein [Streptomyces sp. DSM 42041]MDT0377279.1 hypothetical protein [Streptomyces sp. DSM 42041]
MLDTTPGQDSRTGPDTGQQDAGQDGTPGQDNGHPDTRQDTGHDTGEDPTHSIRPPYVRRLAREMRPYLACGRLLGDLGRGSAVLTGHAATWCQAKNGATTSRIGGLLLGATFAVWAVQKYPAHAAVLEATAWALAAWTVAAEYQPRSTDDEADPEAEPEESTPPSCEEHRRRLLEWLEEVTRDRSGIHLSELYATLRKRPALAHLADPELRRMLDHYQVPVQRTLRVGTVAGRTGVARTAVLDLLDDLDQPLPAVEVQDCVGTSGERP